MPHPNHSGSAPEAHERKQAFLSLMISGLVFGLSVLALVLVWARWPSYLVPAAVVCAVALGAEILAVVRYARAANQKDS